MIGWNDTENTKVGCGGEGTLFSVMATADLSGIVQSCSCCCQPATDASNSYYLTLINFSRPKPGGRLSTARRARIVGVHGEGKTHHAVFLSVYARRALADYLNKERPFDATGDSTALLLSTASVKRRRPDARLSGHSIKTILERIGRLHDAQHEYPERHISPLRPHDLRHMFAFQLAHATNTNPYQLERRLGHRSQRYIARYTNPPEHVAASYVEQFVTRRRLLDALVSP